MGRKRTPILNRINKWTRKTPYCWNWIGSINKKTGYGKFTIPGKPQKSSTPHRQSWVGHNGPIPIGMCVLHRCDNRLCVKPGHLFLGTKSDNMKDMISKGRQYRPSGELAPFHKLKESQVIEMRKRYIPFKVTCTDLAKEFGISERSVREAVNGTTWSHLEQPKRDIQKDFNDLIGHAIKKRTKKFSLRKLTPEQVLKIRKMYLPICGEQTRLAKLFGTDQTNISAIVNRKTWKHI